MSLASVKARFELAEIIGVWSLKYNLSLPQTIEMLEKELQSHRRARLEILRTSTTSDTTAPEES